MSTPITIYGETVWMLPPLILHPFNERVPPAALLENSKAALMLSGLIPAGGADPDDLKRKLLAGRYSEIRMLFYLGKDILRWLDQCVEWVQRVPELQAAEISRQSFAALLTANPPDAVREKLLRWGVSDYVSIFSRAIALNTIFTEPPEFEGLAEEFLRNYHRYTDALFECHQQGLPHSRLTGRNFSFELYASSEYSKMLETEWESQ